jgi:hypothetical protein
MADRIPVDPGPFPGARPKRKPEPPPPAVADQANRDALAADITARQQKVLAELAPEISGKLGVGPLDDEASIRAKAGALTSVASHVDHQLALRAEQDAMLEGLKGPAIPRPAPIPVSADTMTVEITARAGIDVGDEFFAFGDRPVRPKAQASAWIAQGRAVKIGNPKWLATTKAGFLVNGPAKIGPHGHKEMGAPMWCGRGAPVLVDFDTAAEKCQQRSTRLGDVDPRNPKGASAPAADIRAFDSYEEALAWSQSTPP